jgi:FdhE protein
MTGSLSAGLKDLGRQHPEWEPWLAVMEAVLSEAANAKWDALVPARNHRQENRIPLLAGITLALDTSLVRTWIQDLFAVAARRGTAQMSSLNLVKHSESSSLALFESSLWQNRARVREAAARFGADADAFEAVSLLIPVPLLHACARKWDSCKAESWTEGYCPICGAWPALAEVRGIERSHYFRCGRCGGGWQAQCLSCPYCGTTDHNELASLVPEKSGSMGVVNVCKRCLGYVKTFTRLQGSPPAAITVDDLASVDLDVAAVEQGYKRPEGLGYSLEVAVVDGTRAGQGNIAWRV